MKKVDFLRKYRITEKDFRRSKMSWKTFLQLKKSYEKKHSSYLNIAQALSNLLAIETKAHSTRFRVKNPEHLIEKIIRKNSEKPGRISKDNYKNEITDIVGVRVLHLYKKDWLGINNYILKSWQPIEKPKAYIRKGDDQLIIEMYEKNGCEICFHPKGYRSIHYLIEVNISNNVKSVCEIQVRTIFEEGWSEIDHGVRYPYITDNSLLEGYLTLLNKICSNADDMTTFIDGFLNDFERLKKIVEEKTKLSEEQKEKIKNLENKIQRLSIENDEKEELSEDLNSILPENNYIHDLYELTKREISSDLGNTLFSSSLLNSSHPVDSVLKISNNMDDYNSSRFTSRINAWMTKNHCTICMKEVIRQPGTIFGSIYCDDCKDKMDASF